MPVIMFLFMNLIVMTSSFFITYKIFQISDFVDALLCWFVVYFAEIVFTELLLGISGILYIQNIILFNLSILLIVYFITRNRESSLSFVGLKEALIELLSNKIILLGICLILGFGLAKVLINLINPPFGWDCLNYHFVFPVEWLKHANLDIPITISDDPSPSYYPINGSLFFFWLMLPLKNVFMADLGQVPFFIVAFLAIYAISRKLGINRELSFYAAGLFMLTPNVFKQLEITYVDVIVAALFLAGINFLLALYKNFSLKNSFLWAMAFGLFLGTKTSALVYGMVPFLFFNCILLKNIKKIGYKRIIIYFLVFIFLVITLGGFTYIRNFIQTANPLYPADIKLVGKRIFKGVMPFSTYRNRWTKEEFNLGKFLFHEGMGAQFIIFVIPAAILSIPLFFIKRKKNFNFSLLFILSSPILLYLLFYLFMPQLWVRYLYPFLGISFVVAMYFIDLLGIPRGILRVLVFICFLASVAELCGHMELASSFILSILFFIMLPRIPKLRFNLEWAPLLILTLFLISIFYYLNFNYDKYEFNRYLLRSPFPKEEKEAWVWINNNTKGSRIAYVGRPDVLPLYGTNFKNDVLYVSVNNIHPVKLHYFPHARYVWVKDFMTLHRNLEEPFNYRGNADYSVWLKNLKTENIDYLLIYSLHQVKDKIFPLEDNWAMNHLEIFDLAFENNTVHIYKISKDISYGAIY